jgi:hypothetical protein
MSIMGDDNGGASILEMEIDIDIDAMEEMHWSPESAAVGDDSVGGDIDEALGKCRLLLRDVTCLCNVKLSQLNLPYLL